MGASMTSRHYLHTGQRTCHADDGHEVPCAGFGRRDWRLPNRREWRSFPSLQTRLPALPEGHPFMNVFNDWYWSATTVAISPSLPSGHPFCNVQDIYWSPGNTLSAFQRE